MHPAASTPASLGPFHIQSELTPAATYLALDPSGRRVVLKILDDDCLLGNNLHPMIKDRLGRVRELAHVGVANLLSVERDGMRSFLVWDYVPGETLEEHLGNASPTLELARRIVRAVEGLHALGIVHGALHERNIIVTPGSVVLVHVSPLLFNDPQVDIDALLRILSLMGFDLPGNPTTLREIATALSASRCALPPTSSRTTPPRRGSLLAALFFALIGAIVALLIYYFTRTLNTP